MPPSRRRVAALHRTSANQSLPTQAQNRSSNLLLPSHVAPPDEDIVAEVLGVVVGEGGVADRDVGRPWILLVRTASHGGCRANDSATGWPRALGGLHVQCSGL